MIEIALISLATTALGGALIYFAFRKDAALGRAYRLYIDENKDCVELLVFKSPKARKQFCQHLSRKRTMKTVNPQNAVEEARRRRSDVDYQKPEEVRGDVVQIDENPPEVDKIKKAK